MLGAKPFAQLLPEKLSGAYARHAAAMDAYLSDFWARTQPLVPLDPLLEDATKAFEAKWAAEQSAAPTGDALDLSKFGAEEELRALGLDRLKRALVALGLKHGGRAASTRGATAFETTSPACQHRENYRKRASLRVRSRPQVHAPGRGGDAHGPRPRPQVRGA